MGCGALGPLLRGSGWWWLMAFIGGLVLVSSALLRRLGAARALVPAVACGVQLATITLLFGGGTGLFWLVPTPESFDRFGGLIDAGLGSIAAQSTPAEPTAGILFLLAVGVGLIAVLMDVLAVTLGWPALAGLPVLVPVAAPGLLVAGGTDIVALTLAAAAFLVLLRVDVRERGAAEDEVRDLARGAPRVVSPVRRGARKPGWAALVVGGIGIVSALLLSAVTPALTVGGLAGNGASGVLFGGGINPSIDLGQDLRRPEARSALHYTTTANQPPYFRLLTLDRFVGTTWTARPTPADPRNTVDSIDRPPGLSAAVKTTLTSTAIVIDQVQTTWLPSPSPPKRVVGLIGRWYWSSQAMTIESSDSTTSGQSYTVTALDVEPTATQLRDSGTNYPAGLASSLHLPADRPAIIDRTARQVTAGTTGPYDAALALQEYLRGGAFSYDTRAPVADGYDGSGVDVIGTFLQVRKGYCVHFASAMAVMARVLGIPARLALGYLPGSRTINGQQDPNRYNVDSHDLHAWPELYFAGVGWVPFEPTPGRGTVPDYAQPAASAPQSRTDASQPDGSSRTKDNGRPAGPGAPGTATGQAEAGATAARVGVLLVLMLAVLLAPGVTRRVRRVLRRRRILSGRGGPPDAWAEITDTALDHGVPVRDTQTPRELAARLTELVGGDGAVTAAVHALDRLLVAEERHRYGRPGHGPAPEAGAMLVGDLAVVLRALHAGSAPRARALAIVLPASLWGAVLGRARRSPAGA